MQETKEGIPVAPATMLNSDQEQSETAFRSDRQLLEQEQVEAFKSEIHKYMLNDRPFLNPDFSVYLLADAMEIPRHPLSFVLSHGFSQNFYQFVNSYRLEEFQSRLADLENKDTILNIAFACGFSSKSTYNTLFKEHCGCTPSQYRKLAHERQS